MSSLQGEDVLHSIRFIKCSKIIVRIRIIFIKFNFIFRREYRPALFTRIEIIQDDKIMMLDKIKIQVVKFEYSI